ncbi:MAG: hypothetical protein Q6L60_02170 [Thermostichus sp. HHBFW_bins_43]
MSQRRSPSTGNDRVRITATHTSTSLPVTAPKQTGLGFGTGSPPNLSCWILEGESSRLHLQQWLHSH